MDQQQFKAQLLGLHDAAIELANSNIVFKDVLADLANAMARIDGTIGMQLRAKAVGTVSRPARFRTTPPAPRRAVSNKYLKAKKDAAFVDQVADDEGEETGSEDTSTTDTTVSPQTQQFLAAKENTGQLTTVDGGLIEKWAGSNVQSLSQSMNKDQLLAVCATLAIAAEAKWNKLQIAGAIRKHCQDQLAQ